MSKKETAGKPAWYKLDNAGVLYSSIQKESYSAIYRFSAVMTQTVDPQVLQRAVDRTMPRFPGFCMRIKRGVFWYYFEPNDAPGPFVRPDIANPCQPVRFQEDNGWLVRFYYYEKRISIEVFHGVSDGAGTLVLFKTLLAVYLRELGCPVPNECGILDVDEPPRREELEDAYARYATGRSLRGGLLGKAYQNAGTPEPFYTLNVTMGFVPVDGLKAKAKEYGVSITEYLTAVLLKVIVDKQHRERPHREKPVALAIPINLRAWFPSETLRNFILTVRPVIDPSLGTYTFEEIVSQVHHFLRLNINRQQMQAQFTGNVRFTTNRLLQIVPIALKNPSMSLSYKLAGVRPYSGTYTNPGAFPVPEVMRPHIRRMEVILGQATLPRVHCASMSYGNTMNITFAGTQVETDTERDFFRFLVKEGLPVRVESNRTK
ncbi:hypothetical protein [Lawsonibacter celer]|uniref:hypothetical protein n=1 Tax=Lawsonibacter celer TaxID=2986526 RepID=UPI0016476920|nr:hypothetical protein [Lawsonibacter celer]